MGIIFNPASKIRSIWSDIGEKTYEARRKLNNVRTNLFVEYVHVMSRWCEEHKIELTGHMWEEQLAGMVGFSKRHYSRLFYNTYGVSPIHFLNEIRINHAKMLFKNEKYKIIDISSLCGFQDGNYFSKVFKEKNRSFSFGMER